MNDSTWEEFKDKVKPLSKKKLALKITNDKPYVKKMVSYNPVLDLHGLSLNAAYDSVRSHIEGGKVNGFKYITIITGKSGEIRKEFPTWISDIKLKKVEEINSGAFRLFV